MKYKNKINNGKRYVVYKHTSPNGKCYIGMTRQNPPEKRWGYNGNGYCDNEHFRRAILKYSWENIKHEILFTNLTKEEAEQKEIELIAHYNTTDCRYGYNVDYGGSGTNRISEETRQKLREYVQGEKNYFYGKHFYGEDSPMYGKHHSNESKGKMKKNHADYTLSNHPKAKSVVQYDKDGNFIRLWECISQITVELGYGQSNIVRVCRYKQQTAYGFIWRYASDIQDPIASLFPTSTPTTSISLSETV